MANGRILWVDNLRAFGIFIVVLAHCIPTSFYVTKLIYGFHMPLFFFISGFLNQQRKKQIDFIPFVKSKTRSLLKPYWKYTLLGVAIFSAVSLYKGINPFSWGVLFDAIAAKCVDLYKFYTVPLWFLMCLFLVEIHFYFLNKVKTLYKILFVIAFSLLTILIFNKGVLPFDLNIAWLVMPFYLLGSKYEYLKSKVDFGKYNIFIWIVIVVLYIWVIGKNTFVDAAFLEYGNGVLYYLGSTLGIVLSVEFFRKYYTQNKYILQIGIQSLYILCLHWFFVVLYRHTVFYGSNNPLLSVVMGGGMSVAVVVLILAFLHLKNKLEKK